MGPPLTGGEVWQLTSLLFFGGGGKYAGPPQRVGFHLLLGVLFAGHAGGIASHLELVLASAFEGITSELVAFQLGSPPKQSDKPIRTMYLRGSLVGQVKA